MQDRAPDHHPIIQKLRRESTRNDGAHPSVPLEPQRTLLLLGPTRAGKSTIVNILRDSLHETPKPQLYSATREPSTTQVGGFRIIDMPGFFDQQTHGSDFTLSNKRILKMLTETIKEKGPVDIVAFVFHLSNGIKTEDIETMLLVKQQVPSAGQKMMLIVTHAEELDEEIRANMMDDFFQHPKVIKANLRAYFNDEILFLGCLRYESLKQNNEHALRIEHENVSAMRKTFIEKCIDYEPNMKNHIDPSHARYSWKWRFLTTACKVILVLVSIAVLIIGKQWWGYVCLPIESADAEMSQIAHYYFGDRNFVDPSTNGSHWIPSNTSSPPLSVSATSQQHDSREQELQFGKPSTPVLDLQTSIESNDKLGTGKDEVRTEFRQPCYERCHGYREMRSMLQIESTSSDQTYGMSCTVRIII